MSNIEKIRQEIERLKAENRNIRCQHNENYCIGYDDAFNDLLPVIDSLPEEKLSEDLNDEIKKFIEEYGYERDEDKLLIAIVARHFAEWQKEQMMKDAVEGEIQMRYSGSLCAKTIRVINEDKFKLGDKVKIIIVKED